MAYNKNRFQNQEWYNSHKTARINIPSSASRQVYGNGSAGSGSLSRTFSGSPDTYAARDSLAGSPTDVTAERAALYDSGSPSSSGSPYGSFRTSRYTAEEKGKGKAFKTGDKGDVQDLGASMSSQKRRVCLLSDAISRSEHTVVDVGEPNGVPRLITCVKAGQGFDWNQDMFLPSYVAPQRGDELERRQDPVQDIWVTDEEIQGMFPTDMV